MSWLNEEVFCTERVPYASVPCFIPYHIFLVVATQSLIKGMLTEREGLVQLTSIA
jgi:hypothetical protein